MAPAGQSAQARLRALAELADSAIDPAEAALDLAALEAPEAELAPYRAHLAALDASVAEMARRGAGGLAGRIDALNAAILGTHGYAGDVATYDDLQNANLMRVIDRRRGLPVAIGILYIRAGRAQGWPIAGTNFPGHFMLRLDDGLESAMIDPFHGGVRRDSGALRALLVAFAGQAAELGPAHTQPIGNRAVLLRLQNNLKSRHLAAGRVEAAATVLESMMMFAPTAAALWHEYGALLAEQGRLGAAIAALEEAARLAPDSAGRHAAGLIARLRNQLN